MKLRTPIILALGAVAGIVLAPTETQQPLGFESEMFSQGVVGYAGRGPGGQSFSYGSDGGALFSIPFVSNNRTGPVCRLCTRGGDEAPSGCSVARPA